MSIQKIKSNTLAPNAVEQYFSDNSVTTSFKNRIINGAMEVSQRGTSVTFLNAGSYLVDRWAPIGFQDSRHSRVSVTSPNAAMKARFALRSASSTTSEAAGGTRMDVGQKIESSNCVGLSGKTVTFSFWLRCSSSSFASVANSGDSAYNGIQYRLRLNTTTTDSSTFSDLGDSTIGATNIANGSLPTAWTKYVRTVTLPAGVNNITFRIQALNLGSTAEAGGNWFEITEIQLEEGSVATPFEFRPIGTELALCQRYYEKCGWGQTDVPGSTAAYDGAIVSPCMGALTTYFVGTRFVVVKRASPTLTFYGSILSATETAGITIDFGTGNSLGAVTATRINTSGLANIITANTGSNGTAYRVVANAEL